MGSIHEKRGKKISCYCPFNGTVDPIWPLLHKLNFFQKILLQIRRVIRIKIDLRLGPLRRTKFYSRYQGFFNTGMGPRVELYIHFLASLLL
jgi:hypothetical protein